MGYPDTYKGYAAVDKEHWNKMVPYEYKPKEFGDRDIDIEIEYCGVCGSDLHTLRSGWGPTHYPVVVGHEVIGKAVKVGKDVREIAIGDVVGVGAAAWACGDCHACNTNNEQYCPELVETYNWKYKEGWFAYGGYADYIRIHEQFVFKIPDSIPKHLAAPMMCAGLTLYSPLKRGGAGPGVNVGVIGIGGLGHFGLMFAKAMGAHVTAISHSDSKKADATKMGADKFISTNTEGWDTDSANVRSIDLLLCTNYSVDMPLDSYIGLLKVSGTLVIIGIPEGKLPAISAPVLMASNAAIRGTNVGSKAEAREMLELASKMNIEPWVTVRPMSQVNETVTDMHNGKARYRYVLKAKI
ncbi:hypothetical protein CANCADRAFT_33 [Tortispora caseinolytica NRRL Y-17796]|uniref:Enoyl reductase (ER) domain-containing protein n=1 Tax=Tortispora caseinolytica NRRL Y-17796 TaxID=767744 RepID=A0A1E4TI95_9ASCO|nr:hypothetical protein CANCADRAFT_33 [Tortispora caseinolytica NRRL Y-17796]